VSGGTQQRRMRNGAAHKEGDSITNVEFKKKKEEGHAKDRGRKEEGH
jgi:hypothetical protein